MTGQAISLKRKISTILFYTESADVSYQMFVAPLRYTKKEGLLNKLPFLTLNNKST